MSFEDEERLFSESQMQDEEEKMEYRNKNPVFSRR